MDAVAAAGWVTLALTGGGAVVAGGRLLLRTVRGVDELLEDWRGAEGRPGVPARPGVMVRLAGIEGRLTAVEGQLSPNGGGSLHDQVARVARAVTGEEGP